MSDEVGEKLRTKISLSFSGGIAGGIFGFQFYKPLFLKAVKRTPPPPNTKRVARKGRPFFRLIGVTENRRRTIGSTHLTGDAPVFIKLG
jgi:hypothetical protein